MDRVKYLKDAISPFESLKVALEKRIKKSETSITLIPD